MVFRYVWDVDVASSSLAFPTPVVVDGKTSFLGCCAIQAYRPS